MRPEALNFIVCPDCAGELSLGSDASRAPEDGHIMAGTLACRGCASQFSIRNGVPILLSAKLASVKLETASRFAEEWTRWSDLRDYYEQEFFDWVAPLTAGDFANQIVFEGGGATPQSWLRTVPKQLSPWIWARAHSLLSGTPVNSQTPTWLSATC